MNKIKLWNELCDILESAVDKYPLFFGTRQLLYSTKVKSFYIKENILLLIPYMFSKRVKDNKNISFNGKIAYYIESPSSASINQAKSLKDLMKNMGMADNLIFIIGFQVLKHDPKWIKELDIDNIQWIQRESALVYNSIFKLLQLSIESFFLTIKLKGILIKTKVYNNIVFDFNKVMSCIFKDLVSWHTGKYIYEKYGKPKILMSASDMVPSSHAMHALASSQNIPNYVYQHGLLGILQSRRHPKTESIVWGNRHAEYLMKIEPLSKLKIIGSLRLNYSLDENINSNNTEKKILFLPGGMEAVDRVISKEYLYEYNKGIKLILNELAKSNKIVIRLRPGALINNYWSSLFKNDNIILSMHDLSLNEEIKNADICLSDFSTTGYEAMLFRRPALFYFPYDKSNEDVIGICVPEQTFSNYEDIVRNISSLVSSSDYYDYFMLKQNKIVGELFVSKIEKNKRFCSFIMDSLHED
jgi:hypothetical protein